MTENIKRIDVHHHITPQFYVNTLKNRAVTKSYGQPFPPWTPATSLAFMKKTGISKAIMSITTPEICSKDASFYPSFTRQCNTYMKQIAEEHPAKFGGFASLPMLQPKKALDELHYALDELQLDGIHLMTQYDYKYPGHKDFENIFYELDKRRAIVFIHPAESNCSNTATTNSYEITRAVASLIYSGILERYPSIAYILANGGDIIPYLAWRLEHMRHDSFDNDGHDKYTLYNFLLKNGRQKSLTLLHRLYYDSVPTSAGHTWNMLRDYANPSQIVLGTDFPMDHEAAVTTGIPVKYNSCFEQQSQAKIYGNHEKHIKN